MDNMTGEVQHLDDEQEFYKSENNDEAFHDEEKENTKKKKKKHRGICLMRTVVQSLSSVWSLSHV